MRRQTIVTLDFPPLQDGGIARWMDELARGLVEVGAPTTVLTRGRKPPALAHDATHPAPVTRLPGHGWVRRAPLYLRLYAPFLGALRGAVVHAATWAMAAPLAPTVRRRGGHLVVYVHGLELVEGPDAPRRATLAAADLVVANSRHVAALAVQAGAEAARVHVVAPAIDPARVTPDGPDLRARWGVGERPVILTLGRLVERKGQDTVIAALPALVRARPDLVYVIAGQGPDRARLEAHARALGVEAHVRFVGFVAEAELAAAYRSADLYVMVARASAHDLEGFGITYLEANAAGRAVVAGRSGGVEDAVADGETGVLVEPTSIDETAAAIGALLADPARRAALGAQGRARVEQALSRAVMARRVLDLVAPLDGAARGHG